MIVGAPHVETAVEAFKVLAATSAGVAGVDVLLWVVTAMVASGVSLAFIVLYWWAERSFFRRVRWGILRPVAGGLACAALGLLSLVVLPQQSPSVRVLGTGESLLTFALVGGGSLVVVLALLLLKSLATVATVGSGGSGGLVFPALILGGLSGALVSAVVGGLGGTPPAVLPVVGLTATLGAVLNVPIASAVLAVELFGTSVTVPAVLGTVIGFVVGRPWVVYQYRREEDVPGG
jgi:CIC family chloride channel protein